MHRQILTVIAATTVSWEQFLYGCAACGFQDDTGGAFLLTAAILTLVPLSLLGGICWYIKKKSSGKVGKNI